MRYYEIISECLSDTVVGVCCDDGIDDVDSDSTLGVISKKDFEAFADDYWETPKSKLRYRVVTVRKLERIA